MAAHGIKLAPIKMGDLVAKGGSGEQSSPWSKGKYIPPSKRSETDPVIPTVEKVDMSDKNFPSLGPSLGQVKTIKPAAILTSLSDRFKEGLRLDAIAEGERSKAPETDPLKMTGSELDADGWFVLNIQQKAQEILFRPIDPEDSLVSSYMKEADWGMSYDDYLHHKLD